MPPLSIPQATNRTVPLEDHARPHEDNVHDQAPFEPWAIARMAVALLGAAVLWFRLHEPLAPASVIGIATLAFAGWPMFKEAFENLLARRMTMELSMSIAILAAAAISEFFTAVVVMLFVLVAEELEHLTVARGRLAIKDLIDFVPRQARVRRNGDILTVPVDSIVPGDTALVSPGEKVPVDGTVVSGHSYVDQSRITGESMPAEKTEGASVYAGSINQMGALEIRVERIGRDTSYGRIVEAVEQAEQTRAPVQRLADQLAGYLVYFAVGAAILTYALTRDVRDTISVVIVAGACGIAAGTPLAILGGIGRAARLGSIIKGGVHLETLGRVDTVELDKTGTLTVGEPAVQAISPAPAASIRRIFSALPRLRNCIRSIRSPAPSCRRLRSKPSRFPNLTASVTPWGAASRRASKDAPFWSATGSSSPKPGSRRRSVWMAKSAPTSSLPPADAISARSSWPTRSAPRPARPLRPCTA